MRGSFRAAVAMLAGVGGLALAAPALAATNQPIAATGGAVGEFTIAGMPLKVTVELNKTTGDITSVTLDPQGIPVMAADGTVAIDPGTVATADSPTKVRFETADGTTKVTVKAKKNSLSMGVRTDSLDKLVGDNTWAGEVFPGAKVTVPYTIGNDNGAPTFKFGTLPTATDVTVTDLGAWNGSHGDDDDDSTSAGGRLAFDSKGFRKTLTIAVRVHTDDGQTRASLSVTLVGKDIQRLPLADLAGTKTWEGQLCDGSTGKIEYTVTPEGAVTVQSTTPTADVKTSNRGVLVKFPTGDKVSIKLSVPSSGVASLKIDRRGKNCTGTRVTAPDPSVGDITVSTTASGDRKHGGKDGGKRGSSTTTAADGSSTSSSTVAGTAAGRNRGGNDNGGRNRGGNGGGNNGSDD